MACFVAKQADDASVRYEFSRRAGLDNSFGWFVLPSATDSSLVSCIGICSKR